MKLKPYTTVTCNKGEGEAEFVFYSILLKRDIIYRQLSYKC